MNSVPSGSRNRGTSGPNDSTFWVREYNHDFPYFERPPPCYVFLSLSLSLSLITHFTLLHGDCLETASPYLDDIHGGLTHPENLWPRTSASCIDLIRLIRL